MQITTSIEHGTVILPSFIIIISKIAFFLFLVYSVLLFASHYQKSFKITFDHGLILLFYFFQLTYSIITVSDLLRYLMLILLYLVIPPAIAYSFKINSLKSISYFNTIIYILFTVSIILNIDTLFGGSRYQGLLYNANLYGFVCVFWMTILLLNPKMNLRQNYLKIIFIFLIFATIILSGSRTSLMSACILLAVTYFQYLRKIILPMLFAIILIYFMVVYLELDFILERFIYSDDLVSESGRSLFWDKAINYIKIEPWWGYGMDAPDNLINTNIHNNYLRYLFSMGTIFTVITLIPLLIFIARLFFIWYKKIPKSLVGYFCAFIIANFGEDYFIGITATSTVFTLIILGLVIYFINHSKKVIKDENFAN